MVPFVNNSGFNKATDSDRSWLLAEIAVAAEIINDPNAATFEAKAATAQPHFSDWINGRKLRHEYQDLIATPECEPMIDPRGRLQRNK